MPVISTYIYIFNLQSDSTINYAALLVIAGVTEEIGQRIAKATRDAVGRRRPYLAGAVEHVGTNDDQRMHPSPLIQSTIIAIINCPINLNYIDYISHAVVCCIIGFCHSLVGDGWLIGEEMSKSVGLEDHTPHLLNET